MLTGFVAELILKNLIKSNPKLKAFRLPSSEELIRIASSSTIGRQRIKLASPYLLKEFRIDYRHKNTDKTERLIDWKLVPNSLILDYIFGIDAVVNILGFVVAIDVTSNPKSLQDKRDKLTRLKPLWKQLGIDKACVCYLNHSQPISLWEPLKAVIKQSQVIAISL